VTLDFLAVLNIEYHLILRAQGKLDGEKGVEDVWIMGKWMIRGREWGGLEERIKQG